MVTTYSTARNTAMTKRPLFYFAKVGHKMIAKLERMVEEDREFINDQMFVDVDKLLAEPTKKERDQWIRTLSGKG